MHRTNTTTHMKLKQFFIIAFTLLCVSVYGNTNNSGNEIPTTTIALQKKHLPKSPYV